MIQTNPPGRIEYLKSKKEEGKKICLIFPIHFHKEIIESFDIVPVEIWGPPGKPYNLSSRHLQSYICPIVKNFLEFYLEGGLKLIDYAVFPHTCDSVQGIVTVLVDMLKWGVPTTTLLHSRSSFEDLNREFAKMEILKVIDFFKKNGEKFDEEKLRASLKKYCENNSMKLKLYELKRRKGVEGVDFWRIFRAGEYMRSEDYNVILRNLIEELEGMEENYKPGLIISGIVPEPMEIFSLIKDEGFVVVDDDYASCGRRILENWMVNEDDPVDEIVRKTELWNPCSTLTRDVRKRVDYLKNKVLKTGARGLIIHTVKFCEPELFDVPFIEKEMKNSGIPVLHIETNLEKEIPSQTKTRIQAFLEAIR